VKPSDSRVASIASYLRSQLYVADELIDSSHGYLNLRNGLLNLDTFELEEHQRDLYLTSQRSIDYDPNATCPTFDTEMDVWMRDASGNVDRQKQAVLMEAFGYSLTPETRYEKAIWLYGPAASGKSTILKVLMMLSGNAGTTLAFDYLDKNSYQLANLQGKQVAVCSEAATNSTVQSDLVKQLVSGDPMMVRQIFGAPFTLLPQVKLWYAANELPYNPDRSEGIYRRLIILEFHNSIPANERDPHLLEKLEEELPGILNKALAGLKRLQEQGRFTESSDIDASVNAYRAANDHELAFVEECCNVDERHTDDQYEHLVDHTRTMSSTLNNAYNKWRQQQGLHTKSGKQLAPEWERLGFKKKRIGGRFYWLGIEVQTQIT
ncbi:hypothetical protein KC957_04480, partial [Candidatus Saccharibacteria bacterium]|nr:hypothetical protein [Candidatus Saccharibacteria bacterium]